jgi:hypothetical protein
MQDRIEAGEYVRPCDGGAFRDAVVVHSDDDGVFVAVIDARNGQRGGQGAQRTLSNGCPGCDFNPDGALAVLHGQRCTRAPSPRWRLDSHTLEGAWWASATCGAAVGQCCGIEFRRACSAVADR